jgi:antitoxin FitA
MAQVLVRDLSERVVARLKHRARQNKRSLQAEVQLILERAAVADVGEFRALAGRIRQAMKGRSHSDSASLIAADRQR